MLIRPRTQHGKCSICTRRKVLIRSLSKRPLARKQQFLSYRKHLQKQYADRVAYWRLRAASKLSTIDGSERRSMTIIVDSVDHSKFTYPRALALGAKEFAKFLKPTLQVTAGICHGRAVFLFIREHFVQHDSSWSCDIVANMLHRVAETEPNMREMDLYLCGDNSSKEIKCNAMCRMVSGLVSCHRLRSGSICTLQSGHSHEDIDQFFSSLSTFVHEKCDDLETPVQFRDALQRFLNLPSTRPLEPLKVVELVTRTRAWTPG